jgi:transketolase
MNGARYAFLNRICDLVKQGQDIVLVSSDYAAPMLDEFRRDYPDRYVSVGIAEQNLAQVASGLALAGRRVVAYSMAPFPCIRAYDQIRNSIVLMHLPISMVFAGVGFFIPEWGATHYNVEDMSLIRTLPGVQIINATDTTIGALSADYTLTSDHPLYIRFDKYSDGTLYKQSEIDFAEGFRVLQQGEDLAIVTCGWYTDRILKINQWLKHRGIFATIIDLYSIPYDKKRLMETIEQAPMILTIEEHILQGGIGSEMLELLEEHQTLKKVRRMGIDFVQGYPEDFGSREYYLVKYGLADADIMREIGIMTGKKVCEG